MPPKHLAVDNTGTSQAPVLSLFMVAFASYSTLYDIFR